jgi:hypothetical protein
MIAHLVKETVRFKKIPCHRIVCPISSISKKIKQFSPDEVTSQQIFGFYI